MTSSTGPHMALAQQDSPPICQMLDAPLNYSFATWIIEILDLNSHWPSCIAGLLSFEKYLLWLLMLYECVFKCRCAQLCYAAPQVTFARGINKGEFQKFPTTTIQLNRAQSRSYRFLNKGLSARKTRSHSKTVTSPLFKAFLLLELPPLKWTFCLPLWHLPPEASNISCWLRMCVFLCAAQLIPSRPAVLLRSAKLDVSD